MNIGEKGIFVQLKKKKKGKTGGEAGDPFG